MITDIRLQHFRSYSDEAFELSDGVNIIVGPNASGKTNLLEAILIVARGKPYRGGELIQFDKPWARLEAHGSEETRVVKLESKDGVVKKSFEINDQKLSKLLLNRTIPVVLFEPQHLRLLTGQPDLRRTYIDDMLEQMTVGYGRLRNDYRRVVTQRNALLKKGPSTKKQLFAWNIRLSELGAQIVEQRKQLVERLNKDLAQLYGQLASTKEKAQLSYMATCTADNYASELLHKLEKNTDLDYARGFTAYGPHREDIQIMLGSHPAQNIASRGETRTLLLALKIIELQLLERERDQKPLLFLDDVFSELDVARRRALTEFLKDYQTFITTTDADVVVQHFTGKYNVIAIQEIR